MTWRIFGVVVATMRGHMIKALECIAVFCIKHVGTYITIANREISRSRKRKNTQLYARYLQSRRQRQMELWGDQSKNHPYEWLSILVEEVGELAEAINETYLQNAIKQERGGKGAMLKECVQVAAVAVAFCEGLLKSSHSKT